MVHEGGAGEATDCYRGVIVRRCKGKAYVDGGRVAPGERAKGAVSQHDSPPGNMTKVSVY